jgi:putative endonuclease
MTALDRQYCVYLLASHSRTLYVGVTGNLARRVGQHKQRLVPGFTAKYNVDRLVYYEVHHHPDEAIRREKQIKRWRREKKVALIRKENPYWEDLAAEWGAP